MKKARDGLLITIVVVMASSHALAGWYEALACSNPQGSLGLTWVPMGSHSVGYQTWDLVATVKPTASRPDNDWTNAHLEVTTSRGEILQIAPRYELDGTKALQGLWGIQPELEWETFAIGAPKVAGNYVPWTPDLYGAPEIIYPTTAFDSQTINVDWSDYAEQGPGSYHIFRVTVSDDWDGTYSGYVCDSVNPGSDGASWYMVGYRRVWLTSGWSVGGTNRGSITTSGSNGDYHSDVFGQPYVHGSAYGTLDILGTAGASGDNTPLKLLIDLSSGLIDPAFGLGLMQGATLIRAGDPQFDAAAAVYAEPGRTWDAILLLPTPEDAQAGQLKFTWDFADSGSTLDGLVVIPEPTILCLLAFGGLALLRRRVRKCALPPAL